MCLERLLDKNAPLEMISTHCVLLLLVMGENVWNLLLLHSTSMYMTMCVCLSDCQSVWLFYALQSCFNFKQKFCIYENIDTLSPTFSAFSGIQFNSTYLKTKEKSLIKNEWADFHAIIWNQILLCTFSDLKLMWDSKLFWAFG